MINSEKTNAVALVSSRSFALKNIGAVVARSVRISAAIWLLLFVSACTERPSEEECLRSFENFLRLNTGSILSEEELARMSREAMSRDMAAAVCAKNKSRARVLCEIEAKSLAELKACDSL